MTSPLFWLKNKNEALYYKLASFYQNPQKRKLLFLFFIIISFGIILPTSFASAGLEHIFIKSFLFFLVIMISAPIAILSFIIAELSGLILKLMTSVVRWAAVTKIGGYSMTQPADNPFIDAGLKITMPLTNMIFILAFVTIAIATILGIESYGIKKLLPILIIMALLVNFAPVFVGLLIDAANVVIYYFIKGIDFTDLVNSSPQQLGYFVKAVARGFHATIAGAEPLGYLRYAVLGSCADMDDAAKQCNELRPGEKWNNEDDPDNPGIMLPFLYLVGAAVAMVMAAISLTMITALLIVRNLIIWLLVILAPLAFAAYVLPYTRTMFQTWLKHLIQWVFMGVVACFFLYLGSVLVGVSSSINIEQEKISTEPQSSAVAEQTSPNDNNNLLAQVNSEEKEIAQNENLIAQSDGEAEEPIEWEREGEDRTPLSEEQQEGFLEAIVNMVVRTAFPVIVIVIGLFASISAGDKFSGFTLKGIKATGKWIGIGTGAAVGWAGMKALKGTEGAMGKEGTRRYELAKRLESSRWVPFIKPGRFTTGRREEISDISKKWKEKVNFDEWGKDQLYAQADELKRKKVYGKGRTAKMLPTIQKLTEMDALREEDRELVEELDARGYKKEAKAARKKLPTLVMDSSKTDAENKTALKKTFKEMSNEERQKVQPKTYRNYQATLAGLETAKDYKEFNSLISNHKSARIIGAQLIGLNKLASSVGQSSYDTLRGEMGDEQTDFLMQQFGRSDVQRKIGVKYDQSQNRFVKT